MQAVPPATRVFREVLSQKTPEVIREVVPNHTATRTKAAWEQLADVNVRFRPTITDPLKYYRDQSTLLGGISYDDVDADLIALINERRRISLEAYDTIAAYRSEQDRLEKKVGDIANLGEAIGSTNRKNPQGDASAGRFLFGLIGVATVDNENKRISASVVSKLQDIHRRR